MKLCRFQPLVFSVGELRADGMETHPSPRSGFIVGETVREIAGQIYGDRIETGQSWPLQHVKLLPPVVPGAIICIGRNYREHAAELDNPVPEEPMLFLKPPSAVIGPEEPILLPAESQRIDYEGELALVIGRTCARGTASENNFLPYLLGFTCLNDVTARDIQKRPGQFTRAKSFDTFCPLGPVIETSLDLEQTTVETYVDGQRRQSGRLTEMLFPLGFLFRWISRVMTLAPGDVIATGTPSGVGPLHAGNVVEVVVSGIGTLRNPVSAQASSDGQSPNEKC